MTDQQTLLQGKPWIPSHHTNVQDTWRKFGWQPVSQLPPQGNDPTYQKKGSPMDDSTRQARHDREVREDFLAANPSQHTCAIVRRPFVVTQTVETNRTDGSISTNHQPLGTPP